MKAAHIPGIFNDVMGPVMRGPSSSHTAAAHRIGSMIRQACGPDISKVSVRFDKSSALATTYLGQGSALGLAGGLLGLEMTDPEIVNYEKHLGNSSFSIEYLITDMENKHPNAYDIHVQYPGREDLHILAISTGGGMIKIVQWNDFSVALKGDFFETLLFYRPVDGQKIFEIENKLNTRLTGFKIYKSQDKDKNLLLNIKYGKNQSKEIEKIAGLIATPYLQYTLQPVMPTPSLTKIKLPFSTEDEMLKLASDKNLSLSELAILYESACTGMDAASILKKMEDIVLIIKRSIEEGLKGTHYKDRILGAQSPLIGKAIREGRIQKTMNSSIIACTAAIMEVKSSMGVIVAAPTAGSCGVVGGALFGSAQEAAFDLEAMTRAFLAAGIVGVFIADKYTFSAEEGGCQVEAGSASAMAAAGLVELNGGTAKQATDAASLALQNQLGLVCDPVAARVEVPCLGKNIMAANNAYNAYVMALSGFETIIPYSEVIDAMRSIGEALPSTLCCTGLGGLAQTPAAKRLHKKFNEY